MLVSVGASMKAQLPWRFLGAASAICTAAVIAFNLAVLTKMRDPFTKVDAFFSRRYVVHSSQFPFNKRVVVSTLMSWLESSGLSTGTAFFVVQVLAFLAFFLLFGAFCWRLRPTRPFVVANLLLASTSFPLLFVFVPPMEGWDDVAAWVAIASILLLLQNKRYLAAVVVAGLGGALIRETVLLMLAPVAVLVASDWADAPTRRFRLHHGLILAAMILAILAYERAGISVSAEMHLRHLRHHQYNFANPLRTTESLYHLFLGLGVAPIPALLQYRAHRRRGDSSFVARGLPLIFATTLPLFLLFTVMGARLREIRVLFPALLACFPMAVMYLASGRYSLARLSPSRILACTSVLSLCSVAAVSILGNPKAVLDEKSFYRSFATLKAVYATLLLAGVSAVTLAIAARSAPKRALPESATK